MTWSTHKASHFLIFSHVMIYCYMLYRPCLLHYILYNLNKLCHLSKKEGSRNNFCWNTRMKSLTTHRWRFNLHFDPLASQTVSSETIFANSVLIINGIIPYMSTLYTLIILFRYLFNHLYIWFVVLWRCFLSYLNDNLIK